jgi:hypothetical protein
VDRFIGDHRGAFNIRAASRGSAGGVVDSVQGHGRNFAGPGTRPGRLALAPTGGDAVTARPLRHAVAANRGHQLSAKQGISRGSKSAMRATAGGTNVNNSLTTRQRRRERALAWGRARGSD